MLPGVSDYRNMMIGSAMDRGYVESPFRVRRYMRLTREKGRAANQACNMPIQNIPPMVIGTAMINIHRELPKPARLWMQVHDEILCVYPKTMRDVVAGCVLDNLRKPVPQMPAAPLGMAGGIVFNCDVEVGPHWGAVRKIDEVVELEKIGEDPWRP
jgi:DNA polymerase I-like protein with 3'-5' exonuclease and polymerase domains